LFPSRDGAALEMFWKESKTPRHPQLQGSDESAMSFIGGDARDAASTRYLAQTSKLLGDVLRPWHAVYCLFT
jgi:hypothetical protein